MINFLLHGDARFSPRIRNPLKIIRLNTLVSIIGYFVQMDKPVDILTFLQDLIGELCHWFPLN
jgi:hypothetical protein